MRSASTIRSFVFALVFLGVMSVSFLVEARDVPEGAVAVKPTPNEFVGPPELEATDVALVDIEDGLASWYGGYFHGRRTASGRRYDMNELTAAHKNLPFGTLVRAENVHTGEAIIVEITDRGPYIKPRVIDLSKEAARRIGVGVTKVELGGLTPEALYDFYLDNDSTVIGINAQFEFVEVPFATLNEIRSFKTYSKAMKARIRSNMVFVVLNEKGKPSYRLGTPVVEAMLSNRARL